MTETHVRSRDYEYDLNCRSARIPASRSTEVDRPAGAIPHHLPGTNPFLEEFAKAHGVPIEGARGGAETLYPEYTRRSSRRGRARNDATHRSISSSPPRRPRASPSSARFAGAQQQNFDAVQVRVLPAQGDVYMLTGAGGNVTVQTGPDGVLVVDTQFAQMSEKILAAIRGISKGPIRYIVDTHVHGDHVGGNENIRKAGATIAGGNVSGDIRDAAQGAQILAHDNVLMTHGRPEAHAGDSRRRVAHQHLHRQGQEAVLQRRGRAHHPRAGRAHRRRQHRVLPPLRRDQHRRHLQHHQLPRHRRRQRRHHQRDHRRASTTSSTSSSRSTDRRVARWSSRATAA